MLGLEAARAMDPASRAGVEPALLAYHAMILVKLRRRDAAEDLLLDLEELLATPRWSADPGAKDLLREARALFDSTARDR